MTVTTGLEPTISTKPMNDSGCFPPSRSRETCPSCGYGAASVNYHRGIIHCSKCHRTQPWPLPIAAVEHLTGRIQHAIEEAIGHIIIESLPTSFSVNYDGAVYTVTVTRSKLSA